MMNMIEQKEKFKTEAKSDRKRIKKNEKNRLINSPIHRMRKREFLLSTNSSSIQRNFTVFVVGLGACSLR